MARTADATKAHWLHIHLSTDRSKLQLGSIRVILDTPAKGFTKQAWVQGIEKNYNHVDNYYLKRGGLGVRVIWQRSGGKLRKTLKETFGQIAVESPLRQDLKRHFGNNARNLINVLETCYREKKLTPKETADLMLTPQMRQFALEVAKKEGQFTKHLSEWMFHEKNWIALCSSNVANKVTYYGKSGFGSGVPQKFFRLPNNNEKKNWQQTGAKIYTIDISKNLQNHRKWLDFDLQWIRKSATTQRAAGDIQIFTSMTKVMGYRNALKKLLSNTERDDIIKKQLFPDDRYDELYVSTSTLKTRRGFIIGINYGRKLGVSDKDMGF